jgi:periplasmic protein TonB
LKAARARKPAERPLTLAIVGDDASVPRALQAGSNSVLRKPILVSQVKDTLETARSLLKAKQGSAGGQNPSPVPSTKLGANEAHLRAGDFLTSARPTPSAQFDTEAELQKEMVPSAGAIDQLKDLEPMAAAVTTEQPAPAPPIQPAAPPTGSRGLQWYLNRRTTSLPSAPTVPMPAPPPPQTPELMGYDQMAAGPEVASSNTELPPSPQPDRAPRTDSVREQKAEAELFSYIAHGGSDSTSASEQTGRPRFRLGKAIVFALALAACAMVAAPQAPWHPAARRLWARGQRSLHTWLNPQIVEPAQAPEAHEDFARAGDEYKLPVAENIPDATTDPAQIRVVPVVDPSAKKPGNAGTDQNPDGSVTPADSASPSDAQAGSAQVPANTSQPAAATPTSPGSQPPSNSPSTGSTAPSPLPAPPAISPAQHPASNSTPQPVTTAATRPPQRSNPPVVTAANSIPSSLKSQMASSVPDASGNKSPDTAMPAIEPVAVPEAAERALITGQTTIAYPADAKGQQGTVILQLLIGRDGTVEDAKFLQGSLAFARAAIDGVRVWKFKPYLLNGRPVSVQTQLTLRFSPS